jgi:MFS family permease
MSTTVSTPQTAGPPLWAPVRIASYRNLLVGQTTSLLGDQLLLVALPFIVLGSGAGPVQLGQVFAAYGAARVVGLPLGGWIADRIARRTVMIWSDLLRFALVLGLFGLLDDEHGSIAVIAAVMAAVGLAEGLFLPASYAILPSTVPPELLGRANGLNSSAQNLTLLVGPGLGGLLAAGLSPHWCLAVDAATFAISVLTLLAVRTRPTGPGEPDAPSGPAIRFLATSTLMRMVLLCTLVSNLAYYGMLEVALPVHSADVLEAGEFGFGTALAAFGLGSLLGGLLITVLERLPRRGVIACAIGVTQGLCFTAVAFAPHLAATAVLMGLAGLTCGVLNVFYLSRIQQHVPAHLLGRAMSLLMLAVFAVHPASVAAAGLLTKTSGPALVFIAAGVSIAIAFVIGAATRTYREL